ncbi:MAG: helix-turn-helix transcriptional regulator [Candidatus Aminicenantes bacterium]|nr:helix-turn-helix transcriptional regulator [Candidatus Aminicenantes bacterium]
MKDLNLTEEMVLWAVWRLKDDAYGVSIRDHLSRQTDRLPPYGTLYSALAKLERLSYVRKTVAGPTPVRGGRSKNCYRITPYGLAALKAAAELKTKLWDKDAVLALEKS